LAAWSGLGYYRRARMMRQCAQEIVADHRGHFPKTSGDLQTLPGIGRYTAAAIASIAFAERVAVVDGNVERVLQRLAGRSLPAKEMWRRAQSQISPDRPADFNQSMMELGAIVCTPRQPKCEACPVRKWCATRGESPSNATKQSQSKKEIWYTLDHRDGRVRLVRRSATASLMAGMWELPSAGPKVRKNKHDRWRTFRHSITTTNFTVHVIRARATKGKWIPVEEISHVPLTGLTRKILKAAGII
jgi:A/G-specific adenine glycosylase